MSSVPFWKNVRRIRIAKKISQKALARALGYIDNNNSNISTAELHSPIVPEVETILRIAAALGVAPRDLFKDEHGNDIETPYDVLRRSTDIESARQELKRFKARRRKPKGSADTHRRFQLRAHASDVPPRRRQSAAP
jgi:transcriptional regulator with XRE-family HTH domain